MRLASVHAPFRTYYQFRNSLALAWEYGLRFPGFLLFVVSLQLRMALKILLFIQPKKHYLRAMFSGLSDGLNREFGRIPEHLMSQLSQVESKPGPL